VLDQSGRSHLPSEVVGRSGHYRPLRRWVALFLLVAGWGVPLSFPHVSNDDLLCTATDSSSGSTKERIDDAGTQPPPDHCVICHAARTFRTSVAETRPAPIELSPGQALASSVEAARIAFAVHRLPARAPPQA
jgi:Protein of unknown function (DUF2946)